MIDLIVFYAVSAIFQSYTGGDLALISLEILRSSPGGPHERTIHRNPVKRVVILETGYHLTSHPTDIKIIDIFK